jgi:proteasome lid subunit RPN8/RPN11
MKIKYTLLLSLALLITIVILNTRTAPEQTPIVHAYTNCTKYETADEAAIAALKRSFVRSKEFEMGGVIYKMDNKFCYSEPVTTHDSMFVQFDIPVEVRKIMVGIYHTHPIAEYDEYGVLFSQTDVQNADKFQMPSYLGILYSGEVKKHSPIDLLMLLDGRVFSRGVIVGYINL